MVVRLDRVDDPNVIPETPPAQLMEENNPPPKPEDPATDGDSSTPTTSPPGSSRSTAASSNAELSPITGTTQPPLPEPSTPALDLHAWDLPDTYVAVLHTLERQNPGLLAAIKHSVSRQHTMPPHQFPQEMEIEEVPRQCRGANSSGDSTSTNSTEPSDANEFDPDILQIDVTDEDRFLGSSDEMLSPPATVVPDNAPVPAPPILEALATGGRSPWRITSRLPKSKVYRPIPLIPAHSTSPPPVTVSPPQAKKPPVIVNLSNHSNHTLTSAASTNPQILPITAVSITSNDPIPNVIPVGQSTNHMLRETFTAPADETRSSIIVVDLESPEEAEMTDAAASSVTQNPDDTAKEIRRSTPGDRDFEPLCFDCGVLGHHHRKCPNPTGEKFCYLCGQRGGTVANCPTHGPAWRAKGPYVPSLGRNVPRAVLEAKAREKAAALQSTEEPRNPLRNPQRNPQVSQHRNVAPPSRMDLKWDHVNSTRDTGCRESECPNRSPEPSSRRLPSRAHCYSENKRWENRPTRVPRPYDRYQSHPYYPDRSYGPSRNPSYRQEPRGERDDRYYEERRPYPSYDRREEWDYPEYDDRDDGRRYEAYDRRRHNDYHRYDEYGRGCSPPRRSYRPPPRY